MQLAGKPGREFFRRDAVTVARELIGMRLVHTLQNETLVAEITETEAYCGIADRACHAYGGRKTPRTSALYLDGGHAYLYLIYGIYDLFNVVVSTEGDPCAVLVRGGQVCSGFDTVAKNRTGKPYCALNARQRQMLLSGPGRFCRGLGLTRAQNKTDLLGDTLYLLPRHPDAPAFSIGCGTRIGVEYAGEDALLPYRFFLQPTEPPFGSDSAASGGLHT